MPKPCTVPSNQFGPSLSHFLARIEDGSRRAFIFLLLSQVCMHGLM